MKIMLMNGVMWRQNNRAVRCVLKTPNTFGCCVTTRLESGIKWLHSHLIYDPFFRYLHAQGIVHRNLKLENIIADAVATGTTTQLKPGEFYDIKIADLGESRT